MRQSPIGIARVTEIGFPAYEILVPQPDEVTADLDIQYTETKNPSLGMKLHSEMLEDSKCSDPLLAS
jgi:hypothetical protein